MTFDNITAVKEVSAMHTWESRQMECCIGVEIYAEQATKANDYRMDERVPVNSITFFHLRPNREE